MEKKKKIEKEDRRREGGERRDAKGVETMYRRSKEIAGAMKEGFESTSEMGQLIRYK